MRPPKGSPATSPDFRPPPSWAAAIFIPPSACRSSFADGRFGPELGAEETLYSQRLQPATTLNSLPQALNEAINRNVLHFSMEVRPPTLAKIFDHKPFGYVLKHTFEPYATYRYQTGIGNFADIIRFDYRDILADTNEVEYGVTNRLYAKKTRSSGNCFRDPHYLPAGSQIGAQQWTDAKEKEGYCDDKQGGGERNHYLEAGAEILLRSNLRWCGSHRSAQRL